MTRYPPPDYLSPDWEQPQQSDQSADPALGALDPGTVAAIAVAHHDTAGYTDKVRTASSRSSVHLHSIHRTDRKTADMTSGQHHMPNNCSRGVVGNKGQNTML